MQDLFDAPPKPAYKPYSQNPSAKPNYSSKGEYSPRKSSPIKEIVITELYKPFFVFSIEPVPPEILEKAKEAAQLLQEHHYTLRTDTVGLLAKAFEPILTRKEEYLPWQDFNEKKSKFHFNTQSSKNMAKLFSPKFEELKKPIQAFQARNARSVLGQNVKSPIHLAIVWTPDGAQHIRERTAKSAFVSHPLALVSSLKVPVFNLQRDEALTQLKEYLQS